MEPGSLGGVGHSSLSSSLREVFFEVSNNTSSWAKVDLKVGY